MGRLFWWFWLDTDFEDSGNSSPDSRQTVCTCKQAALREQRQATSSHQAAIKCYTTQLWDNEWEKKYRADPVTLKCTKSQACQDRSDATLPYL